MRKKLYSSIVTFAVFCSMLFGGAAPVRAFDAEYLNGEGMELGYSIINGYSKLSAREGLCSFEKAAVYCGLDVTNPYILSLGLMYYLTHGVDLDKAMTDNEYALEIIEGLDSLVKAMGVSNPRAAALKRELSGSGARIICSFDTAGLFIISSPPEYARSLTENESVDFVMADGKIPPSMKDMNMDGKSDKNDAPYIQSFLADGLADEDGDIEEYYKFACDINGDKELDILDAEELLKNG
ncbi:MAG: hypothetical protein IIZ07_07015 [Ruminococcus sp.]|nr:hypothetical protein [Ruminococcus sp.]